MSSPTDLDLDVRWIHGARSRRRSTDPPLQVHECEPDTVILRQSKAVSYEAPFVYLLFGEQRALLLDTGATKAESRFPLRRTVDGLISEWLSDRPVDPSHPYELVVAHTHAHQDHVAGDAQFIDRPHTTVVNHSQAQVAEYFGISDWPQPSGSVDLGGRQLTVLPTPGHHKAAISVYDHRTCLLFTGDTLYPGRLYVEDFSAFLDSLDRLAAFAEDNQVSHILGGHVEMTRTPGRDYPIGSHYQPLEASLPMSVTQLRAVRDAAHQISSQPGAHQFDDFAIYHGPCTRARILQGLRLLADGLPFRK